MSIDPEDVELTADVVIVFLLILVHRREVNDRDYPHIVFICSSIHFDARRQMLKKKNVPFGLRVMPPSLVRLSTRFADDLAARYSCRCCCWSRSF